MARSRLRLMLVASLCVAYPAHGQLADMVFINGKVYTADREDHVASAFAVRGNRFIAVGFDKAVRRHIGPHTKVLDLKGRFVSPGLGDAHLHNEGGGPGIDLSNARSIADILAMVSQEMRRAGSSTLIVSNADWHEAQLKEQRVPSLAELNGVAPDTPVILVRGGHSMFLNSAALNRFGITRETPVPAGGQISRAADGALTGEIIDTARDLVKLFAAPPLSEADLVRTQEKLNSYGLTAVRIPGFYKGDLKTAYRLMREMANASKLTLRYTLYLPGMNLQSGDEARRLVDSWGVSTREGDAWVRVDGIKIMVDGGFEGGHLFEPYAEPYGKNGTYRGIETIAPDRFKDIVITINEMGWRPTVHAAGDAAVAEVLEGFAAADARSSIRKKRWTIEHASLTTLALTSAMKRLGVQLSMQDHMYLAGPIVERYWGASRANRNTPLADFLRKGLLVAGGTDAPVVPVNPFWELYFFASRDTISGRTYGEAQSIKNRAQLLRLVTINFARLIGEEKERGSIEMGKLADFTILSDDFLTVDLRRIKDMKALETYIDGRRVYHNPAFD
jgi:predicted amidohydrolase YtcJ